jgi:hypothetical protein
MTLECLIPCLNQPLLISLKPLICILFVIMALIVVIPDFVPLARVNLFSNPALKRLESIFGEANILQRYTSNTGIMNSLKRGLALSVIGCFFAAQERTLERLMSEHFDYGFDA